MLTKAMSRTRDAGFTLVELLLAITIMGFITAPIGTMIISYARNSADTTSRLSESHDIQTSAAYFSQDVASLGTRGTTFNSPSVPYTLQPSVNAAAYPCAQAGVTAILSLAWNQYDTAGVGTVRRVTYGTAVVGTQTQLQRLYCTTSSAPVDSQVLAHNVVPGSASASCPGGNTGPMCTLTMTVLDPADKGSPTTVTLTGQRRQT